LILKLAPQQEVRKSQSVIQIFDSNDILNMKLFLDYIWAHVILIIQVSGSLFNYREIE
jgi:hypothetical protein